MSMKDCFDAAGVTEEEAAAVLAAPNPQKFLDEAKQAARRRKELISMQKIKHEKNLSIIMSHPKGPRAGLRSLLTNDMHGQNSWSNVEFRAKTIQGQAEGAMGEVFENLSTRMFGLSRGGSKVKSLADDFIREVMGDATGNAKAARLSKRWNTVAETLRMRFNNAGGNIGKLDTWGMPQSHSQSKVSEMGLDEWKTFIEPRLKNADEVDLDYIFETITTGGLNKVNEVSVSPPGGRMLANQNNDSRVLHFKDGESWLEYNQKLGESSDPLAVMSNHIRSMSQDIANLEIMGPNPDRMFDTLLAEVKHAEALEGRKYKKGDWYDKALQAVVTGKVDESAGTLLENISGTMRSMQVATKLGSAMFSSVTDLGTVFANAQLHNMSGSKALFKGFQAMFSNKTQKEIGELGFALDTFNATVTNRFSEVGGPGFWTTASEAVMRATGLSRWTDSLKKGFQYELYNKLGRDAKKGNMDTFSRYGWTEEEVKALDFENLNTSQQTRILEMVNQETSYAVLEPTARVRAMTTMGHSRGTAIGEAARTAFTFKSFPAAFTIQQVSRIFMDKSFSAGKRTQYGIGLFLTTTVLGALAMEMKDKSKGYKEGRKGGPFNPGSAEDSAKYWGAAIMQGGGVGIFGDFIFSDETRYGSTKLGVTTPQSGTVGKALDLTMGNIKEVLKGEDTHFGSEAVDFVNRELNPLNLWYSKAAFEFLVAEQLKDALDPNYRKTKRRKERKRKKEYGQTSIFR